MHRESARSRACTEQEVFTEYEAVMICTGSAEQGKRQVEMYLGKINEKNLPSLLQLELGGFRTLFFLWVLVRLMQPKGQI